LSGDGERPMLPPDGSFEATKIKYLFDIAEYARRVVIPGRDGDHLYMFGTKAGIYFIDEMFLISIEDVLFRVGTDQNGQDILERGKVILVVSMFDDDDDKDTDSFVGGYTIRETEYEEFNLNMDEMILYFDATQTTVCYRYAKEKVMVFGIGSTLLVSTNLIVGLPFVH